MSMNLLGRRWPAVLAATVALGALGACTQTGDRIVSPKLTPGGASRVVAPASANGLIISQVYGGGGNAGSNYTNDFIELYNGGTTTITLTGWSVQYAATTGVNWSKTDLTGSIAPGGHYLIQEAAGNGGTTPLPTANATGSISMAAGAGKVALVNSTALLPSGTGTGISCPIGTNNVVDFVGYGSGTNCFEGTVGPTPNASAANAVIRKGNGTQDTQDNAADFVAALPNPRNDNGTSTTTTVVLVSPSSWTLAPGATKTFSASASTGGQPVPNATFTWTTSDPNTASIVDNGNGTATVTGVAVSATPVTITATLVGSSPAASGTASVTVSQPTIGHVTVSAGTNPLVMGYQTQVFVNQGSTNASGNPVTSADVTWSSSDPSVLTVDARGVVSAKVTATAMSATITGTAADGSAGSVTITTEVPLYNANARVGHNLEFGTPTDATPANDVQIDRKQYSLSYNPQLGGPNWVSWDLSVTHLGTRDRCNCYTADTALARLGYGAFMYNTADYTGGGYDRGHMEPSADQTVTDGENAETFFLTNFLPQAHALNAGPWEDLEQKLRDSVRAGREAYIIAGGIWTNGVGKGSLKKEGKIFIPDSTWKIVVLMPAGTGLANVTSATDINVIAVNMPNDTTTGFVYSSSWTAYKTTVQKIQQSTGYDFLSALPEAIECKVEVRNCIPQTTIASPATITAGQVATFGIAWDDADGSADAPWKVTINWGDGTSVVGTYYTTYPTSRALQRQKTWSAPGNYTVTVTITDKRGTSSVTTQQVVVH